MKYRAEIDGLRAVAVIPVILFHAGFELFSGGFAGVDVFFVISGYLITTIIINEMEEGKFSLVNFYERRARRILPALFFVVLVCIPFAWMWLMPRDMKDFAESLIAVATFSSNILFWRESDYFDTAAELKPLLHTWSLAVEEQYYILFPLFLVLIWRFGKKAILSMLAVAFILSLGIAHWGAYNKPEAAFFLLPTRGWEILIGAFCAFYLKREEQDKTRVSQIGSVIGLALIVSTVFLFDESTPTPSLYTLMPIAGAALIILFSVRGTVTNLLLSRKAFVGVGLISYSAYLWHQPIFALTKYRYGDSIDTSWIVFICLATFLLSYLSWKYVELRFRSRARVSSRKTMFGMSLAAISVVGAIGLAVTFSDGLKSRFPAYAQSAFSQYYLGKDYVIERFNQLELKDFVSSNDRKKVIIIGDSLAQDLVNAIYEARLELYYDLSTYHIPADCGNVFLNENLDEFIAPEDISRCKQRYNNQKLLNLMSQADEIWLSSSWHNWVSRKLPQSILNIRAISSARVVVFGSKNFGSRSLHDFYDGGVRGLFKPKTVDKKIGMIAEWMANNIPIYAEYIDNAKLLCGDYYACSNVSDRGLPISFDGIHLTPEGARYYGTILQGVLGYNGN